MRSKTRTTTTYVAFITVLDVRFPVQGIITTVHELGQEVQ
jgi:hypothetical protein